MDDDWSAGHPTDAYVVVVHTPMFQVNENTAVTRHRKWRWWTSKLTDLTDQNPVSFKIVHRLLLIDRADERVDSFQKRPTKTPFRFRLTCLPWVTRSTSRDFPCPEPAARVLPEISSSPKGAAATDFFRPRFLSLFARQPVTEADGLHSANFLRVRLARVSEGKHGLTRV